MNARQKAKKYKKEVERLRDIHNRWMQRFAFEKQVSEIKIIGASVTYYGGVPKDDEVLGELAEIIANNPDFRNSIEVWSHHEPFSDTNWVQGRVKVVMPDA